jgi:uncharacterized phage-associated protein
MGEENTMPYDSRAIANYFLSLASDQGKSLTQMKLQKLVYFAQGWHLAIHDGKPLIDEQVEAWKFGPVIPSLYLAFREYGDEPITAPATVFFDGSDCSDDEIEFGEIAPSIDDHATIKSLLNRIWAVYGDYSAIQLSNITHQPGTPWYHVNQQYRGHIPRGTDIPTETIQKCFIDLASAKKVST